jgi:hypothetical protein
MFTAQLSWADVFDRATQLPPPSPNVVNGDGTRDAFALLFTEVLAITDELGDGHHWVSDFMQHSFSPYRDAASVPSFTIYRLT